MQHIASLGIPQGSRHTVLTVDAQMSGAGGGSAILFVTGKYVGQLFQECFQLVPTGSNPPYYIHNSAFRVGNNNAFNVPANAADLIRQFLGYYYDCCAKGREALISVYRESSNLSVEQTQFTGLRQINEKLIESPKIEIDTSSFTVDSHTVSPPDMATFILVTAQFSADGAHAMKFSQCFLLLKDSNGYFLANDMFRLCLEQ